MSKMRMLTLVNLVIALTLAIATVESEQQQQQDNEALASKISQLYKNPSRWNGGGYRSPSASASASSSSLSSSNSHFETSEMNEISGSSTEFVCGRAPAFKKYDKSQAGQLEGFNSLNSASGGGANGGYVRNKYRPFEIRMPRIIGGDETSLGEFPWTVSVKLNGQPICGGSLINRNWILTAAHCVVGYNPKNLTVRMGAYRIKDPNETQTIESPISLFIVHKQYSMPRPFSNDIALLKMASPIDYSDFIVPICLPTEDAQSSTLIREITTLDQHSFPISKIFSGQTNPETLGTVTSASSSGGSAATTTAGEEEFDTSEGIVVSTKMSDKEISRCFKRLEQNYLNSIGLGSSSSSSGNQVDSAAEPAPSNSIQATPLLPIIDESANEIIDSPSSSQNKERHLMAPPMPVDMLPVKMVSESLQNNKPIDHHRKPQKNREQFVHDELYDQPERVNFGTQFSTSSDGHYGQAREPQQQFAITNNQHQVNRNHHRNNHHQQAHNYQHVYSSGVSVPDWINDRSSSGGGGDERAASLNQNPAIKLTSLPISKELLREIQSVGSMQSLNLGLQQGDIAAMASDLDPGTAVPTGNIDRERVISIGHIGPGGGGGGVGVGGSHAASIRQLVRDTDLINAIDSHDSKQEPNKYSGMSGIVVGWGWVRENDNDEQQQQQVTSGQRSSQSMTLQKVRLPILRNDDCEAWFRSQEKKITLLPSQFCAGFNSGGKDACRGDSGGPMIIEDHSDTGRYKLIGIVSAGIGCARPSLPGLYTRVASFLPWIHAQIMHN